MRTLRIMSGVCVGWLVSVALAQIPPGYEVIQITDGTYYDFGPKINNHGQIVFTRWYDTNDRSTEEIFLYDPAQGGLIQLTNDNIQDVGAVINDDGVIAWSRGIGPTDPDTQEPGLEIMVRTPDGQITRITDNAFTDYPPAINSAAHMVWEAETAYGGCAGFGADLFFYDGQSIEAITEDGVSSLLLNQSPAINDFDQIVWAKYDFCPDPWESEIWMWDQAVSTKLTTDQFEPASPTINNSALVGWFHRPLPGQHALQVWQSGVTTDLTDWGTGPVLNDLGHIAFIRWHDANSTWQQWLYRDERFWQLSDDPFWNRDGDINNNGEVVWASGPTFASGIRFVRRFMAGDLNCDGSVNGFDIDAFTLALTSRTEYLSVYPSCDPMLGDTNADGSFDGFDIDSFVHALIEGG
ncbi:MAG: hypothetical protein CHACPFDD_03566 [Phycisphaerae bacterium]|nr:hypothetical protein [Phycisphaerae bacterium]